MNELKVVGVIAQLHFYLDDLFRAPWVGRCLAGDKARCKSGSPLSLSDCSVC